MLVYLLYAGVLWKEHVSKTTVDAILVDSRASAAMYRSAKDPTRNV